MKRKVCIENSTSLKLEAKPLFFLSECEMCYCYCLSFCHVYWQWGGVCYIVSVYWQCCDFWYIESVVVFVILTVLWCLLYWQCGGCCLLIFPASHWWQAAAGWWRSLFSPLTSVAGLGWHLLSRSQSGEWAGEREMSSGRVPLLHSVSLFQPPLQRCGKSSPGK